MPDKKHCMSNLGLRVLLNAQLARLPDFKNRLGAPAHKHPYGRDWTPAQWYQALSGEMGEYANVRKKFERGDLTKTEFKKQAANELADVLCYLSLLAFQLEIDLSCATIDKFNLVSNRVKSNVYLAPDGSNYDIIE